MSGYIGIRKVPTAVDVGGIWTIDQQAKLKKDGLWPYLDPYWSNVTLLLRFNGENNSRTFTDSSLNNYTVSVSGNTKISTAQSKFDGSSGYFPGTGTDYLSVSTSIHNFGTADFTIEAWIYRLESNVTHIIWDQRALIGDAGFVFHVDNTNKLNVWGNNLQIVKGATNVTENVWHHVVFQKSSGTAKLYLDGVNDASATSTHSIITRSTPRIGAEINSATAMKGYIDELRITKGIARYSSNFSVPLSPFPKG